MQLILPISTIKGEILGKITIPVLVIWAVIGVSLATLYPIAENIQDLKTATSSGNSPDIAPVSSPGTGSQNSQNGVDSGYTQVNTQNTGSGNALSTTISDNSQNGDLGNPQNGNASGNKYLVDNFILNITRFTVELTNPKNAVTGDGFYEIKINPSANHQKVLQSGTFKHFTGTFTLTDSVTFTPKNNTKYHILVYSNYPEHDNRVSKDEYGYKTKKH